MKKNLPGKGRRGVFWQKGVFQQKKHEVFFVLPLLDDMKFYKGRV